MSSQAGIVAIVFGILGGIAGFVLYDLPVCAAMVFNTCIQYSYPYYEVGILLMIFGGVLVIVGVVLNATAPRSTPPTAIPAQPQTPATGKYCTNCRTLNPFEARYCNSCGNEFTVGTSQDSEI